MAGMSVSFGSTMSGLVSVGDGSEGSGLSCIPYDALRAAILTALVCSSLDQASLSCPMICSAPYHSTLVRLLKLAGGLLSSSADLTHRIA